MKGCKHLHASCLWRYQCVGVRNVQGARHAHRIFGWNVTICPPTIIQRPGKNAELFSKTEGIKGDDRVWSNLPFLKLWWWNKTRWRVWNIGHSRLPPVVVVLADDLQDVSCTEPDTSLLARDQIVRAWIIFELSFHINLFKKDSTLISCTKSMGANPEISKARVFL